MEDLLARAKKIVHGKDGAMSTEEEAEVQLIFRDLEDIKPKYQAAKKAADEADGVRSKTGSSSSNGWTKAAKGLTRVAPGDKVILPLGDLLRRKDADVDDQLDLAIRRDSSVKPLLEDKRNLASLFGSVDPGAAALHVEALKIESRGLSTGSNYLISETASGELSVERSSPMSVEAKAEVDIEITLDSDPLKQFALLAEHIPNQAFASVPALAAILAAALGRETQIALEAHVVEQIEAASPSPVSGGADILAQIRRGISDLQDSGVSGPFVAVISTEDQEAIDLTPSVDLPSGFPFCKIVSNPAIAVGEGYVLEPDSAGTLYRGAAALDKDALSYFDTNESRVRMEFNALFVVTEASAIRSLLGAS
jgi:hypothetical protein